MPTTFGPNKNNPSYIDPFLSTNTPLGYKITCNNFPQGSIICRNGGTIWIAAPSNSEVTREWADRDDAVTQANACSNGGGGLGTAWFVPSSGQLKNPGYICRTNWDSFVATRYWSSSTSSNFPLLVEFNSSSGCAGLSFTAFSNENRRVRAFKTITY